MTFIIIIAAVIGALCGIYPLIKRSNNKRNAALDCVPGVSTLDRFINNQPAIHNFRYGLYPCAHNACECIAVHNALLLKGASSSLSQTIRDFHASNAMFGYGFFGTRPSAVGRVLKHIGTDFTEVSISDMEDRGVYIVSYWNGKKPFHGLHTVAVLQKGGACVAFNNACDRLSLFTPSAYRDCVIKVYYLGEAKCP